MELLALKDTASRRVFPDCPTDPQACRAQTLDRQPHRLQLVAGPSSLQGHAAAQAALAAAAADRPLIECGWRRRGGDDEEPAERQPSAQVVQQRTPRLLAAESGPDVEFVFWNRLDRIPAYNEDVETQQPESVAVLKDEIARADAVLFATPEYNGSIPGALKNALDWVSRPSVDNPLRDKPVAVTGASQGAFGATWAQTELRKILQAIGARVHPREFALAYAQDAFAADGLVRDLGQRAALVSIIDALVRDIRRRAA